MAYQLQITPSVGTSRVHALDKPLTKIGRAVHCDVVIQDQLVSREHCLLQIKSEGIFLEDLNSFNGTFCNEERITRSRLKQGDRIRLGLSEIVLEEIPEEKAIPAALPPEPPASARSAFRESPPEKPAEAKKEKSPESETGITRVPAVGALPRKEEPPAHEEAEPEPLPLVSGHQDPPTVLVIHPDCSRIETMLRPLAASGAMILRAADAGQVQNLLKKTTPECILLCQDTTGALEICQEIRSHPEAGPIVLLLPEGATAQAAALLKAGADEVLCHPDRTELQVRLRNMLELHRLRKEANQLTSQMEKRVNQDVSEAERITRLKRYLSPQVVAAVLSGDESHVLKPTRQEVSIVFSDLRNYTHFSETSEPEEIITMLSDFHALYGDIIFKYDGTLERFAGDGVMVFFGAPVPFKDHARRAVAMAVAARERLVDLRAKWNKLGYTLDISFGISTGYVFVGNIGFEGRMDYAAIGKTTNLAARLCAAAKGGEILISRKTLFQVEDMVEVEEIGALEVKGFSQKVMAYNVLRLKTPYKPAPVTG
jgi:adenylate cyclase